MTLVPPARWTAVVNPAAGRRRGRRSLPGVAAALASSALDVTVHVSTSADDARAAAEAAFAAARGVIAVGGDGTVRDLAGVAAETGGVLGVVPTGSGNDFARHLGIGLAGVHEALAVVERGRVRPVDLARATAADGTVAWVSTVANAGFDGEANRWANTVTWTTGTSLYVLAVLRTLVTYRPSPVRVRVDDDVLDVVAWLVAVANTPTYAGGMMIAPAARADDGLLDVCVVGPVSRATFLRVFPSVFRGEHVRHPAISVRRGSRVRIEAREPLELWASGERVGALPAEIAAVPRAVHVMTPG